MPNFLIAYFPSGAAPADPRPPAIDPAPVHVLLGRHLAAGRQYPEPVAKYILRLKQLYPPIAYREIARIAGRIFGYKTNHHTVKRFLTRHPVPMQLEFALETFHCDGSGVTWCGGLSRRRGT